MRSEEPQVSAGRVHVVDRGRVLREQLIEFRALLMLAAAPQPQQNKEDFPLVAVITPYNSLPETYTVSQS